MAVSAQQGALLVVLVGVLFGRDIMNAVPGLNGVVSAFTDQKVTCRPQVACAAFPVWVVVPNAINCFR